MSDDSTLSAINYPIRAIVAIEEILDYGASKGHEPGEWRGEGFEYQLKKVEGHMKKYREGLTDEDHLECALCRLAMAVDIRRAEHGR